MCSSLETVHSKTRIRFTMGEHCLEILPTRVQGGWDEMDGVHVLQPGCVCLVFGKMNSV